MIEGYSLPNERNLEYPEMADSRRGFVNRKIARSAAILAGVGALSGLPSQNQAEAARGYAPSITPSPVQIYELQKQQVLDINPAAVFAEPDDLIYNTKNTAMSCSTGQETFKKAVIAIQKDRRTVKIRLTTKNNAFYDVINRMGSYDGETPSYMVPTQCDNVTKFDATLELDIRKYNKIASRRSYPRKMAGPLARKAIPRHEVFLNTSQPMIGVKPEQRSFTDTITLKAPRPITDRELKRKQIFISYYTQRAQRGVVSKDLPSADAELRWFRPLSSMNKTTRYHTFFDNWHSGRLSVRANLLTSIDRPPGWSKKKK